jgi:hypothetical protein
VTEKGFISFAALGLALLFRPLPAETKETFFNRSRSCLKCQPHKLAIQKSATNPETRRVGNKPPFRAPEAVP